MDNFYGLGSRRNAMFIVGVGNSRVIKDAVYEYCARSIEIENDLYRYAQWYENETPVFSSTGRKVPAKNPKAKPWVSPYGGKRK